MATCCRNGTSAGWYWGVRRLAVAAQCDWRSTRMKRLPPTKPRHTALSTTSATNNPSAEWWRAPSRASASPSMITVLSSLPLNPVSWINFKLIPCIFVLHNTYFIYAVVTCEIKWFQSYFSLRRHPSEIILFQFQTWLHVKCNSELILKLFLHLFYLTCNHWQWLHVK